MRYQEDINQPVTYISRKYMLIVSYFTFIKNLQNKIGKNKYDPKVKTQNTKWLSAFERTFKT